MAAQRLLTGVEYLALTDIYAKGIEYQLTAIGDETVVASAAGKAAAARAYVTAFAAPEDADLTADLIDAVIEVLTALQRTSGLASYYAVFNSAVSAHLGQAIGTWLTAEAAGRVAPNWKKYGNNQVPAANTFPPAYVLGSYAVSGSGAGALTVGTPVDGTLYGGGQVAVKVTGQQVGGANIGVSCTGLDSTGATRTWTGTITANSNVGTVVNLAGTGVTDGMSIVTATNTLGTNGDDFDFVIVPDRSI